MTLLIALACLALGVLIGLLIGIWYANAGYREGFEDGINWAMEERQEMCRYDDDI